MSMVRSWALDPLHVATGEHPLSGRPTECHMKEWISLEYYLPGLGVSRFPVLQAQQYGNSQPWSRAPGSEHRLSNDGCSGLWIEGLRPD
jgi:hypothetical protein